MRFCADGHFGHFYARLPVAHRVAAAERGLPGGAGRDHRVRSGPGDPSGAAGFRSRQHAQLAALRLRLPERGGRTAVLSGGGAAVRPGLGQYAGGALRIQAQPDGTGVPVLSVPHRHGKLLLLFLPQVLHG